MCRVGRMGGGDLKGQKDMELNDKFRTDLDKAFFKKFFIPIVTEYDFSMNRLVSHTADYSPMTTEQRQFIDAFEAGYIAATERVRAGI